MKRLPVILLLFLVAGSAQAQDRRGGRHDKAVRTGVQREPAPVRETPRERPLRPAEQPPARGDGREVVVEYGSAYCGGFVLDDPTPPPVAYRTVTLTESRSAPFTAGFDCSLLAVVGRTDEHADLYFENKIGDYSFVAFHGADIQDLGRTNSIDEHPLAPVFHWRGAGEAVVWEGHTYSVRTWEGQYFRLRIRDVSRGSVTFDIAGQGVAKGSFDVTRGVNRGSQAAR